MNTDHCARAFGKGCDARINGLPYSGCPYRDRQGIENWRLGWHHAGRYWGKDAKWPVTPIKPLGQMDERMTG